MAVNVLIHTRSTSLGSLPLGHKDLAINFKDVTVVLFFRFQMCSEAQCGHDCFCYFTAQLVSRSVLYVVTINLRAVNNRIVFYYYQAKISYKHVAAGIRFVIEIWRTQGL